jgi:hypothetical protein
MENYKEKLVYFNTFSEAEEYIIQNNIAYSLKIKYPLTIPLTDKDDLEPETRGKHKGQYAVLIRIIEKKSKPKNIIKNIKYLINKINNDEATYVYILFKNDDYKQRFEKNYYRIKSGVGTPEMKEASYFDNLFDAKKESRFGTFNRILQIEILPDGHYSVKKEISNK